MDKKKSKTKESKPIESEKTITTPKINKAKKKIKRNIQFSKFIEFMNFSKEL